MIAALVAYANNNVIGNKGDIPWHIPEDLKYFKKLTTGNTIIMGRKTFDSIGKALPNRQNIVVTRQKDLQISNVEVCNSPDDALKIASSKKVFIIGGAEIYKLFWSYLDTIYATVVEKSIAGDTYFPEVDLGKWQLYDFERHHNNDLDADYVFTKYIQRSQPPGLYYIKAGRSIEHIAQMEDLEARGVCVFCEKHFKVEHREPIILETANWMVTKNDYPYKHTELHLLVVPKQHINKLSEMNQETANEYMNVLRIVEKKFKLTSYSQFMRIGDFHHNGASIHHLHGHIISADFNNPDFEKIKVKLGTRGG